MVLRNEWNKRYVDFRSSTKVDPHQTIRTRDVSSSDSVIKRVVFHCTDAPSWSPERLSQFFVDERGWPICGYHYYVMAEQIYHMVGENLITYHAAPWNSGSVAFSIDYFPTRDEKLNIAVNPDVIQNALITAATLCLKFKVSPDMLFGHRELKFTGWFPGNKNRILRKECPGMAIDLDDFRYKVARIMQEHLMVVVDGVFGPKSLKALEEEQWA